jgi:hypothetical protein
MVVVTDEKEIKEEEEEESDKRRALFVSNFDEDQSIQVQFGSGTSSQS